MSYNNFDKIEYEGINYYPRDTRANLVIGTQTTSTSDWTGSLPEGVNSYTDPENLIIDYFLPRDSTDAEATLNLSSLGAKPIYGSHGTSRITNEFEAMSVIRLVYVVNSSLNNGNGAWKVVGSDVSQGGGGGGGGSVDVTKETIKVIGNSGFNPGSLPSITTENIYVDDITNYDQGSPTNISISNGVMTITHGTPTTVEFTSKAVTSISRFSEGEAPSLDVENKTVVTNVTSS